MTKAVNTKDWHYAIAIFVKGKVLYANSTLIANILAALAIRVQIPISLMIQKCSVMSRKSYIAVSDLGDLYSLQLLYGVLM